MKISIYALVLLFGMWAKVSVHAATRHGAVVAEMNEKDATDINNTSIIYGPSLPPKIKYYGLPRPDRTGRQLMKLIALDALAFREGGIAAGLCPHNEQFIRNHPHYSNEHKYELATLDALKHSGLEKLFHYACPDPEELISGAAVMVQDNEFSHHYKEWFSSPEWHADFLSRIDSLLIKEAQRPNARKKVAVHVRRGDITPCNYNNRYLPNSFYFAVLERYLPQHCGKNITNECEVTIYSEAGPDEPLEEFLDHGYNIDVGSTIGKVLYEFITADVLIAGASSFSYSPALMNPNNIICVHRSEFFPVGNFTEIDGNGDLVKAAEVEKNLLNKKYCGNQRRNMLSFLRGHSQKENEASDNQDEWFSGTW